MWSRIFQHLLPKGRAWLITVTNKYLRKFFDALTIAPSDARDFIDAVWLDIFPDDTRALDEWEAQFGIDSAGFSEAERRTRLTGEWRAMGGQDPRYIQDTLQAAGFDVYLHEWWSSVGPPPVARNPFGVIDFAGVECGEEIAECGEPFAECGNQPTGTGFILVNSDAAGQHFSISPYFDEDGWPYILYIGGATFPNHAQVDVEKRLNFEALVLKLCPAQQWLGMLIDYV